MKRSVGGVALALMLSLPLDASAHFLWASRSAQTVACYYVVPVVCVVPARPLGIAPPVPATMPLLLATPTPAGPSSTAEPPLAPGGKSSAPPAPGQPGIREARYYDTYAVAPSTSSKPSGDHCSVGFWNLTNRDISVKVAGRNHVVPSRKNLTLDLERQFAWQVEGRNAETAQVPDSESGLEIVIRK